MLAGLLAICPPLQECQCGSQRSRPSARRGRQRCAEPLARTTPSATSAETQYCHRLHLIAVCSSCAKGAKRPLTMPFGRLSPVSESVSEADTESLHSSRPVSDDLRPRPLNFSRPKPQDLPSSRNVQRDLQYAASSSSSSSGKTAASARGVGAFYEPPPPNAQELPTEPRFSSDSDRDGDSITPSTRSAGSDLVWDNDSGELRSRQSSYSRRGSDFDSQRYTGPRRASARSSMTNGSVATESELPLIAELPGDEPPSHIIAQQQQKKLQQTQQTQQNPQPQPQPQPPPQQVLDTKPTFGAFIPEKAPRILKRISVDQQSERRVSISSIHTANTHNTHNTQTSGVRTAPWEDSRSQHGASEIGDRPAGGEWKSSEYDISELSDKKLAKLKKKGINPQLYMEMKAARGGKGKLVGPLVGNTYIG